MAMGRFEKSLPSVYQHFLSCFSLRADPAFAMVNMTHWTGYLCGSPRQAAAEHRGAVVSERELDLHLAHVVLTIPQEHTCELCSSLKPGKLYLH